MLETIQILVLTALIIAFVVIRVRNNRIKKKKFQEIKPFVEYLLAQVSKEGQNHWDNHGMGRDDPLKTNDPDASDYYFKVASEWAFFKGKYVEHVFIHIKDRIPNYTRIDKVILKLEKKDVIFMQSLLLSWM